MLAAGCSVSANDDSIPISENDVPLLYVESSAIQISFVEAVEGSNCAAIAEYIGYTEISGGIRYEFLKKEVLRGDIPEEIIYLVSPIGRTCVTDSGYIYENGRTDTYAVGDEYLLILQRLDAFYLEHPQCVLPTDIFIPAKDMANGTMYSEPISKSYDGDIMKLLRDTKLPEDTSPRFSKAEDMPAIVAETDLILEVRIDVLPVESDLKGDSYYCELIDILKGGKVNKMDGGHIILTLLKGTVKIGDRYIVLVNRVDEGSSIFTQSSMKSVFHVSDTKAIEEIKELIARG